MLARFRCASIFFITSSNNRTTPSSNAIQKLNWRSKWNCLEIGARAGRAQLIPVVIASDLICFVSCPAATSLRGNHDKGARLA